MGLLRERRTRRRGYWLPGTPSKVSLHSCHIVLDLIVVHQGRIEFHRLVYVGDSENRAVAAAGILVLIHEHIAVGLYLEEVVPGVVEEEMLASVGSLGDFGQQPGSFRLAQLCVCGPHIAGLDLAGVDAQVSEGRLEGHIVQFPAAGLPHLETGTATEIVHEDGVPGLRLAAGVGQHPLCHALRTEDLGVETEIVLIPFSLYHFHDSATFLTPMPTCCIPQMIFSILSLILYFSD